MWGWSFGRSSAFRTAVLVLNKDPLWAKGPQGVAKGLPVRRPGYPATRRLEQNPLRPKHVFR